MKSSYKPIPLVNHKGEPLQACPACSQNGPLIVCTRVKTLKKGRTRTDVRSVPKKRTATYLRNGWKVAPYVCETGGGAGLYPERRVAS
jgi:hypothetical protein